MFTKITDEDREGKGNVGQPDTPELSTYEMQEVMDSLPNLAIDKFNNLIDELTADSAAANMGCDPPASLPSDTAHNVLAVIDEIALEIQAAVASSHYHGNKTLLDSLTQNQIDGLTALLQMFLGINGVASTVTNRSDKIPTSSAVYNYVTGYPFASVIGGIFYPVGSVYLTMGTPPNIIFGGTWEKIMEDHYINYYVRRR